jgi:hypothetical protein
MSSLGGGVLAHIRHAGGGGGGRAVGVPMIVASIVLCSAAAQLYAVFVRNDYDSSSMPHVVLPVVLVLGVQLLPPHGTPPPILQSRVTGAEQAVVKYDARHVILSGGGPFNTSEARVMKQLWNETSYDGSFYLEQESMTTCENAYYSLPILKSFRHLVTAGRVKLVLVTSDYHLPRAKILLEQVFATQGYTGYSLLGFPAPTVPTDLRSELFANEREWLQPLRLQRLLTNMTDHPFLFPTQARILQALDELAELEQRNRLDHSSTI